MQVHGIQARGKRRFRVMTTDSRHDLPIAPNLLDRNFTVAEPNTAWAGDVTYIATEEGWLYLAVVIDLVSRQVVGWSMRPDMRSNLVVDTLEMAWYQRRPDRKAGLIFHSDRGSQYASGDFRQVPPPPPASPPTTPTAPSCSEVSPPSPPTPLCSRPSSSAPSTPPHPADFTSRYLPPLPQHPRRHAPVVLHDRCLQRIHHHPAQLFG